MLVIYLYVYYQVTNFRKHIAFLLTVLFAFPILFQSVHILEHHGNEQPDNHACEHQCSHQQDSDHEDLGSEHERCLVCEYEFAVFNTPAPSEVVFHLPVRFQVICLVPSAEPVIGNRSAISLRAPPSHLI